MTLGAALVGWCDTAATHLIPYTELVSDDYDTFLEARAKLIEADMKAHCDGLEPTS